MSRYAGSSRPTSPSSFRSQLTDREPEVILSRAELRASIERYEQLLQAAKIYRTQMMAFSQAAASFGIALERVSRSKGAIEAGPGLHAAAGLHFMISNHHQILSDAFYKHFEIPLLENFDQHKSAVFQSEENYDKVLHVMSEKIKETEAKNMMSGRRRQRDLVQFRRALQDLTRQVDELERVKNHYYCHMLDIEQKNFNLILSKASAVVRAEVDVYDRITNRGLADPCLEPMITSCQDPFSTYPTTDECTEIFSVLPPTPFISNKPEMIAPQSFRSPLSSPPFLAAIMDDDNLSDIYEYAHTTAVKGIETRDRTGRRRAGSKGSSIHEGQDRSSDAEISNRKYKRTNLSPVKEQIPPNLGESPSTYSQPMFTDRHTTSSLSQPRAIPTPTSDSEPGVDAEGDEQEAEYEGDENGLRHHSNRALHISDDSELLSNREFNFGQAAGNEGFNENYGGEYDDLLFGERNIPEFKGLDRASLDG
ncbi:uncharacterized protein VTP21DRAFT_4495 [Calcarisporiella thermophila]|uniref:uncharacterized protein n=1 Tax=Calcarisporiella thermophila TaxID=911321 RepID=UPI003743D09B